MTFIAQRKRIILASIALVVIVLSLSVVYSQQAASNSRQNNGKLSRVACLGDSITEITGYPEYLQTLIGNGSVVGNFGVSGATVNLWSDRPYYYELRFREARDFGATTVVIQLGTNDARIDNLQKISNFTANYERLIHRVQNWTDAPLYLVIPPPAYTNALDINATFLVDEVIPRIYQVAQDEGLQVIDLYTPFLSNREYFPDGVHPCAACAQEIAQIVYDAIK
ncbi:MAG: GDSL-type esterase/lipase family protein [Candidatus Bathyarchaeota archaeon]|nr:GDSL-type esterase/lipase family protein [Candidatus Bathyarchaeota archaeon]